MPAHDPAEDRSPGYRELAQREPVFRRLLHQYGRPAPFEWHDGGRTGSSQFAAMLLHVVGQRISAVAAFRIYDRISAKTGGIPTPASVLGLGQERLRTCGLSAAKAGCAVTLAQAQATGVIDIEHLDGLSDADVVTALTAVHGIGVWSAETFLIHNLHRPDILPADDLGIRRAVQAQWHLDHLPSPPDVRSRSAAWAPWRTYAATLLWRSLRPRDEASDPKQRALIRLGTAINAGQHDLPPEAAVEFSDGQVRHAQQADGGQPGQRHRSCCPGQATPSPGPVGSGVGGATAEQSSEHEDGVQHRVKQLCCDEHERHGDRGNDLRA